MFLILLVGLTYVHDSIMVDFCGVLLQVVIVNSCLPGALLMLVILKSRESLADTAAALAKLYLSSYLLSIVTIAAWTTLGLWITLPDEDGKTICQR